MTVPMTSPSHLGMKPGIFVIVLSACLFLAPAAVADSYSFTTLAIPYNSVRGINDAGDILATAGQNSIAYGLPNQLQTISLPFSTNYTEPSGINNNGDIVGGYARTFTNYQGFLIHNGALTTINAPGASTTFLSAINDLGQIVGFTNGANGFLLSSGIYTPINVPGAAETYPEGINNAGEVVGWYGLNGVNEGAYLFTEKNGVYTTPSLPAFFPSGSPIVFEGLGISNNGQIVGFYDAPTGGQGFIDSDGVFTSFNVPGSLVTFPEGINDSGQIAGNYAPTGASEYGFVATPVPGARYALVAPAGWFLLCGSSPASDLYETNETQRR